jgi:MoxR-like ATPase
MSAREQILDLEARRGRSIIGQEQIIERLIIGLLANGNLLVEGIPGTPSAFVDALTRASRRRDSRSEPQAALGPLNPAR